MSKGHKGLLRSKRGELVNHQPVSKPNKRATVVSGKALGGLPEEKQLEQQGLGTDLWGVYSMAGHGNPS